MKVAAILAQPLHVPAALSGALFGEALGRVDDSRREAQVKEDAALGAAPLWVFVGALSQDSLGLISAFNFVRVRRPEQKENASQRSFGNVVLMTSAMMVISHPAQGGFSGTLCHPSCGGASELKFSAAADFDIVLVSDDGLERSRQAAGDIVQGKAGCVRLIDDLSGNKGHMNEAAAALREFFGDRIKHAIHEVIADEGSGGI